MIICIGIRPRALDVAGIDHAKALGYLDVLEGRAQPGERVAIVGMGGIAYDVADLLTSAQAPSHRERADEFIQAWGVDTSPTNGTALEPMPPQHPPRTVAMLQRSTRIPGARLGVSTGWIHRSRLARRQVAMHSGCDYERIDDDGLHLRVDGKPLHLAVDHVVICAGQEPNRDLADELLRLGMKVDVIGGARESGELDAARAIDEGTRLANAL